MRLHVSKSELRQALGNRYGDLRAAGALVIGGVLAIHPDYGRTCTLEGSVESIFELLGDELAGQIFDSLGISYAKPSAEESDKAEVASLRESWQRDLQKTTRREMRELGSVLVSL